MPYFEIQHEEILEECHYSHIEHDHEHHEHATKMEHSDLGCYSQCPRCTFGSCMLENGHGGAHRCSNGHAW